MLRWLISRKLDAFEREYDYDLTYLRDVLDESVDPLMRFWRVQRLGAYREGVPLEPWMAAKLVATLHEDCGPCAQLGATMAERAGVDPAVIRAVVQGDDAALPDDTRLAVAFTRATLARDGEDEVLRDQVVERFGRRGLISLAYAITASRLYPTLKYALGHGRTCTQVRVGGQVVPRPAHAT